MNRIGSLCSGYGGLDAAARRVLGGEPAWFAENDPAAATVLTHHWPDVPNLGDITSVDWAQVEPVDVLTAGFPCQDVSLAGARKGLRAGTRSGLWAHVARAVNDLRPPLVFLENVRGLLSAGADSDMEPCPWCVGAAGGEPALRALGAVLGDLADVGYDARWCGLRAADVGAPHGRFRVFVVAWPAADPDGDAVRQQPVALTGRGGAAVAGLTGTDSPAYPDGAGRDLRPGARRLGGGQPGPADRGAHAPADADEQRSQPQERIQQPGRPAAAGCGDVDWGAYAPAVARWEAVLGRRAPAPTITGTRGQPKLSPFFVEWMQGLDEGHVTAVPGLSTNDMLRLLGNGVVPQQGAAALSWLLNLREVAA